MLLKSGLEPREAFRVRGGFAFVVAYMAMRDRRTGLECLLGAFDLLSDADWHSRVVLLGRERSGDGDTDDAG